MKAEREKLNAKTVAGQLRLTNGEYQLQEGADICRILLVSGGSFTLIQRGRKRCWSTPAAAAAGAGGGVLRQAGHLAPLGSCRFLAAVLPG